MSHDLSLQDDDKELLAVNRYSSEKCDNFSICLIDAVASLLDIDPTSTPIGLGELFDLDLLDEAYRFYKDDDTCILTNFPMGGYILSCCTCGLIMIYGDKAKHERGNVPLPASMYLSREDKSPKMTV